MLTEIRDGSRRLFLLNEVARKSEFKNVFDHFFRCLYLFIKAENK